MIAALLRQAADQVEEGDLDRACWRIADAGGRLRIILENSKRRDLDGLDRGTGLGCRLPRVTPVAEEGVGDAY